MRINPKSEKELAESRVLPPGEYDFEVAHAVDAQSRGGNDMIKVSLRVFHGPSSRTVVDYLVEAMAFKLAHFCYAIGLGDVYQSGNLTAEQCIGRAGKVVLMHEDREGFPLRCVVRDYVVVDAQKPAAVAPVSAAKVAAAGAANDEPPF